MASPRSSYYTSSYSSPRTSIYTSSPRTSSYSTSSPRTSTYSSYSSPRTSSYSTSSPRTSTYSTSSPRTSTYSSSSYSSPRTSTASPSRTSYATSTYASPRASTSSPRIHDITNSSSPTSPYVKLKQVMKKNHDLKVSARQSMMVWFHATLPHFTLPTYFFLLYNHFITILIHDIGQRKWGPRNKIQSLAIYRRIKGRNCTFGR